MKRNAYDQAHIIRDRAHKLAETEDYADWQAVKRALIQEGLANTHQALNHDFVRLRLDTACTSARKAHSAAD